MTMRRGADERPLHAETSPTVVTTPPTTEVRSEPPPVGGSGGTELRGSVIDQLAAGQTPDRQHKQDKEPTTKAKSADPTSSDAIAAAVAAGDTLVGYERRHGLKQLWRTWSEAELAADPQLAIKPTPKAVAEARANGLRWSRIAVYAGINVAEAQSLAAKVDDLATNYTGRGRRYGR